MRQLLLTIIINYRPNVLSKNQPLIVSMVFLACDLASPPHVKP